MNKEEATRTLVKIIRESNGPKIITNPAYQNKILFDAAGYSEIECGKPQNNLSTGETRDFSGSGIPHKDRAIMTYEICKAEHDDSIRKFTSPITDANYIFVDTETLVDNDASYNQGHITIAITSEFTYFAVIGEPEIELLKEEFKGDYPQGIKKSAETLGIEKKLEIDYTQLLKEEPKKFRNYFCEISEYKRKEILTENWELFENREVDRQTKIEITQNYRELLEEIARDKLTNE